MESKGSTIQYNAKHREPYISLQFVFLQFFIDDTSFFADVECHDNDKRIGIRSTGPVSPATTRSVVNNNSETSESVPRILSATGETAVVADHVVTRVVAERGVVAGISGPTKTTSLASHPQQTCSQRLSNITRQGGFFCCCYCSILSFCLTSLSVLQIVLGNLFPCLHKTFNLGRFLKIISTSSLGFSQSSFESCYPNTVRTAANL